MVGRREVKWPGRGPTAVASELWRASRPLSATLALLVVGGAAIPLVVATAVAAVVRAVPAAVADAGSGELGPPFAAVVAAFTAGQILDVAREAVSFVLASRVEYNVEASAMEAALRPAGVEHLHTPAVRAAVAAAAGITPGGVRPATSVLAVADVAMAKLSGAGALVLLARWHLWVPVVIGAAWAATIPWLRREGSTARSLTGRRSEALRRAAYFRDLALEPGAAKELRLFGLGPWLLERYATAATTALAGVWTERRRGRGLMVAALGCVAVATTAVFGTLAVEATSGRLPVRDVALFGQLVLAATAIGWAGDAEWLLREGGRVLAVARSVPPVPATASPAAASFAPRETPPTAVFADVAFAYPGEASAALRAVTFTVPPGASVALVGENGAGKSTVVKLLAGLYQPNRGAVLIDGVPLATDDVRAWRSRLACIFQDFARYEASLRDNVALGVADPRSVSDEECLEALRRAGAADLLGLPDGLRTVLGPGYDGATGLSGGQWQRVALARGLLAVARGADIVVLDEPTAALDVRAEAAFFDRLFGQTTGLTRLVVSHRLASVRRADHIVVFQDGTVTEQGPHSELLAAGGWYAARYRTQASAFPSPPDGNVDGPVHV
jgi:ABC-type multidrug transport system fused ATPase/permease subunit